MDNIMDSHNVNTPNIRKKSGFPDADLVTDSLHLQGYTTLCKYLNETKKLGVTELVMSQFVYNILLFMETQFGKTQTSQSIKSKMVKLPHSIFRDFRVSGGLCTVLETAAKYAKISDWVQTNLLDEKNTESCLRLLLEIENQLLEVGLMRRPVFCFGSSVHEQPQGGQLVRELTNIALSHGGTVTDNQQNATFVVLWDDEVDGTLDRELQEEYIRPLEIRPNQKNGEALVHWWYHPDSYDEWIPSQDVQCTDIPDPDTYSHLYLKSGVYQPTSVPMITTYVCCRYLKDVQDFNEWGNLLDYEMEKPYDGIAEPDNTGLGTRGKSRGKKRGIDRRQNGLSRQQQNGIQQNSFVVQAVSVTERMLQDLPPPSVHDSDNQFSQSSTNNKFNAVDVLANKPCGMRMETAQDVTREIAESKEDDSAGQGVKRKRDQDAGDIDSNDKKKPALDPKIRVESAGNDLKDSAVLNTGAPPTPILPTDQLPDWFRAETISTIEMKYNSDVILMNGISGGTVDSAQRGGQKYLAVRNNIVHLYHLNPTVFLTATECRRKIAGDVAYIIRIHEFLDAFGVINYNPEIKTAVRNPKSSIFYSTCPSRTTSAVVKEESSLQSNNSMWSSHLDQVLLQAVSSTLEGDSSSSHAMETEGEDDMHFHEVGGIKWTRVAEAVSAEADEKHRMLFTSVACLVRFTEMSLGSSKVETVVPGARSVGGRIEKYVAEGSAVSKNVRALASVVTAAAADHMDVPHLKSLADAIQSALKNVSIPAKDSAALSAGAAMVVSAAESSAAKKVSLAESHLDDYIALRLSVLEKKMELVGDIEDALLIEKDRVELDRHDLQVERAQHASFVQAESQMNLF